MVASAQRARVRPQQTTRTIKARRFIIGTYRRCTPQLRPRRARPLGAGACIYRNRKRTGACAGTMRSCDRAGSSLPRPRCSSCNTCPYQKSHLARGPDSISRSTAPMILRHRAPADGPGVAPWSGGGLKNSRCSARSARCQSAEELATRRALTRRLTMSIYQPSARAWARASRP